MSEHILTIILAAGQGTRMKSQRAKIVHEIAHLPLVNHVIRAAKQLSDGRQIVVVGPNHEEVKHVIRNDYPNAEIMEQCDRLGTGHAVQVTVDAWADFEGPVLVLFGDTPLLKPETLKAMIRKIENGAHIAVLGFEAENPTGYGRLVVHNGHLSAIIEHNDANQVQQAIKLCNGGVMAAKAQVMRTLLAQLRPDNAAGEYYLTDLVGLAHQAGHKVVVSMASAQELAGVNTQAQLAQLEQIYQTEKRLKALENGVTMQAPDTVYLAYDTQIEPDVVIEPFVTFGPGVKVQSGARLRGFSYLEQCLVGPDTIVGPYARLRPETELARGARVGNFCEIKKAKIGEGAKINHLTYVGDAEVGAGSNIGAGTVFCNYDGVNKAKVKLGENVFVGSNSSLVAPLSVHAGAYVGSGSVITDDVPEKALALGRARQIIKPMWADKK